MPVQLRGYWLKNLKFICRGTESLTKAHQKLRNDIMEFSIKKILCGVLTKLTEIQLNPQCTFLVVASRLTLCYKQA